MDLVSKSYILFSPSSLLSRQCLFAFHKPRDLLRHKISYVHPIVELLQRSSRKNEFVPLLQGSDITKKSERRKAKFKINLITVVSSSAQELKAADK
jgi:hypothetical protein